MKSIYKNLAIYFLSTSFIIIVLPYKVFPQVHLPIYKIYKQCDPGWDLNGMCKYPHYFCADGCAMFCLSMLLSSRGECDINSIDCPRLENGKVDPECKIINNHPLADPVVLNVWLQKNGGYVGNCNLNWQAINSFGRQQVKFNNNTKKHNPVVFPFKSPECLAEIKGQLQKGEYVIVAAKGNLWNHFYLINGYTGDGTKEGDFMVVDPENINDPITSLSGLKYYKVYEFSTTKK